MIFSIRRIIRGLLAPRHRLACSRALWRAGLRELHHRGEGSHESGAFLLGSEHNGRRTVSRFVYYDDLDPHCLDTGIVVFDGAGYGPLWKLCRESGLQVVADVHTHGGVARQSPDDRDNPMIAQPGHIALIVPGFARQPVELSNLGVYEYLGAHKWRSHCGREVKDFLYVGFWG
jgi:proteasome lid subunit RPN8/RPN11